MKVFSYFLSVFFFKYQVFILRFRIHVTHEICLKTTYSYMHKYIRSVVWHFWHCVGYMMGIKLCQPSAEQHTHSHTHTHTHADRCLLECWARAYRDKWKADFKSFAAKTRDNEKFTSDVPQVAGGAGRRRSCQSLIACCFILLYPESQSHLIWALLPTAPDLNLPPSPWLPCHHGN